MTDSRQRHRPWYRRGLWLPRRLLRGVAQSRRQRSPRALWRPPPRWPFAWSITREGWYYLVVVVLVCGGAMLREVNLLLILAGMLCGPLLFGAWLTGRGLQGLKFSRRLPERVTAGELLVGTVDVANDSRYARWGLTVEDRLTRLSNSPGGGNESVAERRWVRVLFPFLPGGQSRRSAYRGRLAQRGRYRVGPLRVVTRFPFGLFARCRTLERPVALTVLPRLGRLTEQWNDRRHEVLAGARHREQRQGPEGDFFGLRPWQSGDPRRLIHWRRTARLGSPVVRQLERPRSRDLAVVLDLWMPARPSPARRDNVELAVSFAATLLSERCKRGGSELLLAVAGGAFAEESRGDDRSPHAPSAGGSPPQMPHQPFAPTVIQRPASPAALHAMMEELAVVEPSPMDALPELLTAAIQRAARGTELVVVSTRAVDLTDPVRFGQLHADSLGTSALRRARVVDTSDKNLERVFQIAGP